MANYNYHGSKRRIVKFRPVTNAKSEDKSALAVTTGVLTIVLVLVVIIKLYYAESHRFAMQKTGNNTQLSAQNCLQLAIAR